MNAYKMPVCDFPTPRKRYNIADRKAALVARRLAVVFLREAGFTFKSIAYAVGATPFRVQMILCKHERAVAQKASFAAKVKNFAVSPEIIKKHTKPCTG